jgi:hypothetical protein
VRGEAVAIDLGDRGMLFSLLRSEEISEYAMDIVFNAFPRPGPNGPTRSGGLTAEGIAYYSSLEAKAELSNDQLPMLVRFRDINDQKSVELVRPDELFRFFGEGVSLHRVTIEMTDDDVTAGIETRLPWYAAWKARGGTILGKSKFFSPPPPEEELIRRDFARP